VIELMHAKIAHTYAAARHFPGRHFREELLRSRVLGKREGVWGKRMNGNLLVERTLGINAM